MQKGLHDGDIVSIISENSITFSVCHAGFESYSKTVAFASEEECNEGFDNAFKEYRDSWKHEKFNFEKASSEPTTDVEEVNDSWGSLASDVFGSFKSKIFG